LIRKKTAEDELQLMKRKKKGKEKGKREKREGFFFLVISASLNIVFFLEYCYVEYCNFLEYCFSCPRWSFGVAGFTPEKLRDQRKDDGGWEVLGQNEFILD